MVLTMTRHSQTQLLKKKVRSYGNLHGKQVENVSEPCFFVECLKVVWRKAYQNCFEFFV